MVKRSLSDDEEEAGPSRGQKVKAEGIERAGPGLDYQVQLLMLFACRGYELSQKQKDYLFELGKERKEAGKFDDIIVRYKQKQDQAWNYLLLQAKYTQDKITTGKLLSDDSTASFTLLKYFSSYIESKKQYQVDNAEEKIESCVIVTNTDFEYDDKNELTLKTAKARIGEANTGSRGTSLKLKYYDVNEILKLPQANGVQYYKFDVREEDIVKELQKEFEKSHKVIQKKEKKKDTDLDIIKNLKDIVDDQAKFEVALREFLDTLLFVVNLPDRQNLRKITKEEIGEELCFLDDFIVDEFNRRMFDYTVTLGQSFLKGSDIEKFFLKMKQKINDLLSQPSYYLKVQNSKIDFKNKKIIESINDFLDPKSKEKILMIESKSMFLTAVEIDKILKKSLKSLKQYSYKNKHTFLNLKELFEIDTLQNRIIESFDNKDGCNLLIIVFDLDLNLENKIQDLQKKLYDIVSDAKNVAKKVVLITEQNFKLGWSAINVNEEYVKQVTDDGNNFSNLTDYAKIDLLDTYVTFQGESISLKQLYFKLEDNEVPSSEQLNKLNIDAQTLESFSKDSIRIEKPFSVSDLEGAYSKFYKKVNTNVLIARLEESGDRFFIISGINGSEKKDTLIENLKANSKIQQVNISQEQICELNFRSDKLYNQHIEKIILTDSEFKEKNFKQLCYNNPDKNFYWINWEADKFILHSLYHPNFLGRKFKYPKKIIIYDDIKKELSKLFKSNDDNVFFFTGVDKLEELYEVLKKEKVELGENYKSRNIIIEKKGDENKFNKLAEKNKSVYWLHIENNNNDKKIIWRDIPRSIVSEKELIDIICDKSSIIIDKPGMGKSTSLIILSAKLLKSHWVILITLRDWQETICRLPKNINNDVLVQFLSDTNNLNTPLEKNLAKYILDGNHEGGVKPLLLLFDGFDEIRSYNTENICKKKVEGLLRFLKEKSQSTIWITAREHDAIRLKNTLSVFDIKFETLEDDIQKQYFRDVWSDSLALSVSKDELDKIFSGKNSRFQTYYKALSNATKKILTNKHDHFMGIPLTLRLFVEGFRSKFEKFIDSQKENIKKDFDNFSILNLYQYFIDEKFKIFFREKTNLFSGFTTTSEDWFKEKLIKLHCRLAFKELFGEEKTKQLLGIKKPFMRKDYVTIDSEQLSELLSFGIIRSIKDDHYEFLHRTIAEYFASEIFIYMLESKEQNNPQKYEQIVMFLKKNILKENNAVIYKFLDARSKQDQALNDRWALISAMKIENLLGQPPNFINSFTFNTTQHNNIEKNIEENIEDLIAEVEECVEWDKDHKSFEYREKKNKIFVYHRDYIWNNSIKNLVVKSGIETDSDKIKSSLKFLIPLFWKSVFGKFNEILTGQNIIVIIDNYILQADLQSKLDKQFIKDCFSDMIPPINEAHEEFIKKELDFDFQDNTFSEGVEYWCKEILKGKLKKDYIGDQAMSIQKLLFLTPKIAEMIISTINDEGVSNRVKVFKDLISPLLSFKYYSKYDPVIFTQIDTFALVNMFSAFAGEIPKDIALSKKSLESLLQCIEYLVHPDNVSTESFTISMKSLIALKNWNFRLVYKNKSLYLLHNVYNYSYLLKLQNEESIAKLFKLKLQSNNVEFNFEQECVYITDSILRTRT